MVNIIGKISKGTRMDQIYLPKLRPPGFAVGEHVEIIPTSHNKITAFTYQLSQLEPIKNIIRDEIFSYFSNLDNVIITGSFLEKGFGFNDIDVILIDDIKTDKSWEEYFRNKLGIEAHFICIDRKSLIKGLKQDPLFQMMMSKYLAKKREIFKFKNEFNYKILDLHLLKSKTLLENFDILNGREKYDLTRNLISIKFFLQEKKISKMAVDREIRKLFGEISELKENIIEKTKFLKKFKKIYNQTFNEVMKGIKNESKQK